MKKTVTIGIPAFNEEANIVHILDDIFMQKSEGFLLEKVIVASDKSTDRTDDLVKSYKNKKVELITSKKREGQAERQNDIFKKSTSDILVLLNADIKITDPLFIKKLITPLLFKSIDLTSSFPLPLPATGFIEKILYTSVTMKTNLFESFNSGQNIYTCHGRARAFSKSLYKKLKFKHSVGEDAYSYMYALTNGFKYKNVTNAKIYYKLPANFADHKNQSARFIKTKNLLIKSFGQRAVDREFALPMLLALKSMVRAFLKSPFSVLLYVIVFTFLKLGTIKSDSIKNTWDISASSKKLYEN